MTDEKKLLEAQQAVLGAMLIDEKTVGLVLQEIVPDDFTTGAYRQVFLAFRAQFASGAACDPVTVNARLGGKYDRLLMELIEITPTSANVKSYVAILKQEARIHRLQDVAQRMLEAEDEDALRALMSEANALSVERPGLRVVGMEDALSKFYVRHDPDAKPVYLDFGMDDINDNVYAGRGDMIVIGGYPSDGKTSLALTLAVRMAKTQRVGFYSYETDADKLFDRIVAMTAQVGLPKLKLNAMNRPGHPGAQPVQALRRDLHRLPAKDQVGHHRPRERRPVSGRLENFERSPAVRTADRHARHRALPALAPGENKGGQNPAPDALGAALVRSDRAGRGRRYASLP